MVRDLSRKGTFFIHYSSGVPVTLGETTLGEACRTAGEKLKNDPGIQLTEKGGGEVDFKEILGIEKSSSAGFSVG